MASLYSAFNRYPDNIDAYKAYVACLANGTSTDTPYFKKYFAYINGNSTEWREIVLGFSSDLRKAEYVMIVQYICALQAPILLVYTVYFKR